MQAYFAFPQRPAATSCGLADSGTPRQAIRPRSAADAGQRPTKPLSDTCLPSETIWLDASEKTDETFLPPAHVYQNAWAKKFFERPRDYRVREGAAILVLDEDGRESRLTLGSRIGEGTTSETFEHPDDPQLVIRVTHIGFPREATNVDDAGWQLFEQISSPHVRAARQVRRLTLADGPAKGGAVRIIERVTSAQELIGAQEPRSVRVGARTFRARMTLNQATAFAHAMAALNRFGCVYLDNKWDNFGLVEVAPDSWQVVVTDPGGVFPVRTDLEREPAVVAREIQLCVNGNAENAFPELRRLRGERSRLTTLRRRITERCGRLIDLARLHLDHPGQLPFNPRSGVDMPLVGPIFEAVH